MIGEFLGVAMGVVVGGELLIGAYLGFGEFVLGLLLREECLCGYHVGCIIPPLLALYVCGLHL